VRKRKATSYNGAIMASPPTPVYSKSNPAGATPMPPRQKRLLIIICAVIAALMVGGGIWAGLASDSLSSSANGCISLNLPGSIGGEIVHACGSQAKAVCRAAYAGRDAVSLAERPACEQAGLTQAKVVTAPG
jgi:hypothetical protein